MAFWWVLHETLLPMHLTPATHPALSLLGNLCPQLLGDRLPVSDVPRFFGQVLELSLAASALSVDVTCTAMGTTLIYYQVSRTSLTDGSANVNFGTPYFTISLSLTVILTIMIIVRLVMHNRKAGRAIVAQTSTSGLQVAVVGIVGMLVESYALYAVNFILFIGPWGATNNIANLFFPILIQTQVRVCLLPHDPRRA